MKKNHLALVAAMGLLMATNVGAAEAAKMKVAVVDFQKAISQTDAGKKAETQLNAALAERKKKFEIMKTELDTLRQDFEKQRLVLTGQALEQKKQALQEKLMAVEKTGASYEQELSQKKNDSLQQIVTGLQGVVQTIGTKEGFDFIFEKSQGGVLFSSSAEDITDRVIKTFNSQPAK